MGIEAGFLNNMLGFELSVYKKKTNDMLLYLPIQGVIGMSAPAQNAGNVENTGFDLNISHNKRINSDFRYAVNFNVSYLKNEITNMEGTEGVDPDNAKYWRLEGHPIGSFYGYKANGYFNTPEELAKLPKRTGKEQLGDIKYVDIDNNGKIDAEDRTVIGKNFPSWTGGLNVAVFYKDFDFSMLWQGAFDVDAYYTGEASYAFFNGGNVVRRLWGRRSPCHPHSHVPPFDRGDPANLHNFFFWVGDGPYVAVENIPLGVKFPEKLFS